MIEIASLSDDELDAKILASLEADRGSLSVILPLQRYSTVASPALVVCADGLKYVVKWPKDKQAVTDSIVGFLGKKMGCPVCDTGFSTLSQPIIDRYPKILSGYKEGLVHTSKFLDNCVLFHGVPTPDQGPNRLRMAMLGLLFGLCAGYDEQFMISVVGEKLIYSHDHGHFIGGGDWDSNRLKSLSPPVPNHKIASKWQIRDDEQMVASKCLKAINDVDILNAVSWPPAEWPITLGERRILARIICERRKKLLQMVDLKEPN